MPRQLTADAIAETAKRFGTEPITIVGVYWNGSDEVLYADKELDGIRGKILTIGALDDVIKTETKDSNASIEVVLDDTSGDLKAIMDSVDIHKKPCIVYQYFQGLDLSDSFIVFAGEINTPVIWDEGERKLTFTILSKIESLEVGFAPEEGQFANVDSSFIGKIWPLAFGEVVNVPATKVTEKIRGITQSLIGIPDYTLPYKYWELIDRVAILTLGYKYYVRAISYLNDIARQPNDIINDYVATINIEDPLKQHHEDLTILIVDNDKFIDELDKIINASEVLTQDLTYTRMDDPPNNQGQLGPIETRLVFVTETVHDLAGVQTILDETIDILASSKDEIEALTLQLEKLKGVKKVLEIETDNAEYAYKNINSIAKKIQKLLIEYVKTNHEIFKVLQAMEEQVELPQNAVAVIGGYRFPQDTLIRVSIKGLTYTGFFINNLFFALEFEPKYINIEIGPREDDQIDAFWVTDPSINLKGFFCVTTVVIGPGDPEYILQQNGYPDIPTIQNRIFKVIDQIGTKCIIELKELQISQRVQKITNTLPVLTDLPNDVWNMLMYAQEHPLEERNRILENAITKYDKEELARVKKLIEKLKDIATGATTNDEVAAINKIIFENVHEYNDKITGLTYTKEVIQKAFEQIDQEEFKTLLKLCNLRMRKLDNNTYEEDEIPVTKIYALTGEDIRIINGASPVMLPSWFALDSGGELVTNKTVIPLPNGTQVIADFLPTSTLWFAEPGSEITLVDQISEKFVANTLPSTIVAVQAYKGVGGIKQLVPVPSSYYTKNQNDSNYLPLVCATVTLKQPLKDYPGEDWEDGIYISLSSSVGSNTVDIIKFIVDNYTNLTTDDTTFNDVAAKLVNYPSNFALFEKKDALQLIQEIAWQARCATYIRQGIMYIRYLSEEPTSIATITESDIEFGSLQLQYTPTEDLVTKFVAQWLAEYSNTSKKNQYIVRYNIPIYAEKEKVYDFYIYNIESLVVKSATYWLTRSSNIFKIAKFKTPLTKLKIETLDCITINTTQHYFANTAIKAIVNKASYDSETNTIEFECWLPVRAGEMETYTFAFPAGLQESVLYPTIEQINAGFAGTFHGSVPKNLAYKINPNTNLFDQLELRPKDYGDAFPSDAGNLLPPSPLEGLSESKYLVKTPQNYAATPVPQIADDPQAVPGYTTPVRSPGGPANKSAFIGKVVSTKDSKKGIYEVEATNGDTFEARQAATENFNLSEDQYVTVVYDDYTHDYIINELAKDESIIKSFVVISESDDYLNCVPFEYMVAKSTLHDSGLGSEQDDDALLQVAKPRLLQKTPFQGKTVAYGSLLVSYNYVSVGQRVASSTGKDDETQIITPPYFVGDIIAARYTMTGYKDILLMDINEGGRQWALSPS